MNMSRAEELVTALITEAREHKAIAYDCDMRPEDTANWRHYLTNSNAAAHLRALDASHQRLVTLLAESQHSIGGDWRDRRDAALESAQALSNQVKS